MKTLTIEWLNKCRCGNKLHTVKTARGNESALWDDDAVKCDSCGRGGVIQVCEGQARVLWETDEEMVEGKPMSTITKEWLQQKIAGMEATRDEIQFGLGEDGTNTLEALRIALESLEAEAVAEVCEGFTLRYIGHGPAPKSGVHIGDRLFTAPPAPVSVPDEGLLHMAASAIEDLLSSKDRSGAGVWADVPSRLRRAAMLQGADGTLTNEGTIPVTQFKPVADLYGLTSPTGGETSFTFDAVEARDFIDGGWSCQEYVELERFQEALTDHSEGDLDMVRPVMFIDGNLLPGDAEKLKAAIEELNHSGEPTIMIAGDSPVIPDGWVMVPVDMPHEMMRAVQVNSELGAYAATNLNGAYSLFREFWDVAVTAAPQQEMNT